MNKKEIGEIRRRIRRDRINMTAVHGCYVNDNNEIVSKFSRSMALMPENEAEKYMHLFRRTLYGTIGKNLIDIPFKTTQVADSPEHSLLMNLRKTDLKDEDLLTSFFEKIIEAQPLDTAYLILVGCDTYDVPFKNKNGERDTDNADETYKYLLCAICPVKQTKPTLHYVPDEKEFQDGGITNFAAAPELGFLFPAFDDRATNLYNALLFSHKAKDNYTGFISAIFNTPAPLPAEEQKKSFQNILSKSLEEKCSMDVIQAVHNELHQKIELHKASKIPEALTISKSEIRQILTDCGVDEAKIAKFSVEYDSCFGTEAELHPCNLVCDKNFEVTTPNVSIRVTPNRADLIETRVIGGIKYILIAADETVEVNGVSIHIGVDHYS